MERDTRGASSRAASTLNSRAYERIRADVLTCKLPPGTLVSEAALVERYKFGKASIRNVLARLIQEGMVVNRGRKGHIVRPLTLRELRDIFQLRLIIEPEAARIAAGDISDRTIDQLVALYEQAHDSRRNDPKAVVARLIANRGFYVAIAQATGNELLIRFTSRVHDHMLRFAYLTMAKIPEPQIAQEHGEIIEAFKARDPERAAAAVQRHIEHAERNVMRAVSDLPGLLNVNLAITA